MGSKRPEAAGPWWGRAASGVGDSGDDRLSRLSTIMGPSGLTAVFGMGTGVAPTVWSPERRPPGVFRPDGRDSWWVGRYGRSRVRREGLRAAFHSRCVSLRRDHDPWGSDRARFRIGPGRAERTTPRSSAAFRGEGDGSGWSSRSAVRTGRLRRSPALHSRPIDLVVFQEPVRDIPAGDLISRKASRLDAFSAYPVPTWLPGGALSRTAGTPEVGPPQSSRTRGEASQVSYAHGR